MKAKDLIKILEQDPEREVKLYNGFVDDWMDISVTENVLIKEKPSSRLEKINFQNERDGLPIWNNLKKGEYKPSEWEFIFDKAYYERNKKDFSAKKVFIINGKRRNLTTFGFTGSFSY